VSTGALTTRIIGRYAIYQALASGGMATVFLGRLLGPVGFARTVAIKRLHAHFAADPKFVAMFLDEARIAARIRHPNVVPTLDVVATDGELFLVMEYVHGESLAKLIRTTADHGTAIPVPVVVAIMSGVLQGLHAAHEAKSERGVSLNIIHRDVSPQNILVGRDGQARLLDFGVARAEERLHTTQEGVVKGKLAYMAPEQVRGEAIGPPTDVYAAAVVMWEALTGRALFRGTGEGGMVVEVLEAKIRPPSPVLRDAGSASRADEVRPLDEVLMHAFARKKDDRWQTARELAREIEACVVPATASQVSDWVEQVAGATLRERASVVTERESSSAVELTQKELGVAIAETTEPDARNDWLTTHHPSTIPDRRASNVPTAKVPPRRDDQEPKEHTAGSSHPDHAPSTTADPQPHTLPVSTEPDANAAPVAEVADPPAREVAAVKVEDPARDTPAPAGQEAPALPGAPQPLPGTLISVPSPVAGKNPRNVPKFAETMQSSASPLKPERATLPAEKAAVPASPAPETPPGSATLPVRPHKAATALVAAILVGGIAGITYAYFRAHAANDLTKPVDTSRSFHEQ